MTAPYRVLVTGSRTWTSIYTIRSILRAVHQQHPDAVLISGRCPRGADAIAEECWAAFCGYATTEEAIAAGRIEPHPAEWEQHGKRAGFFRNEEMVKAGAGECVAFIRDSSRGATHCAAEAEKAGIPVRRYFQ